MHRSIYSSIADDSKNPYGPHLHDDMLKYLKDVLPTEIKLKLLFFFYKQVVCLREDNGRVTANLDEKHFLEKQKLVSIFYPDLEKYICDFCEHCKKDEFSKID